MKIDDDILRIIGASTVDGDSLKLSGGQLDRATYLRVAKALECAGAKWNRKRGCHIFDGDAEDRVQDMLTAGEVIDHKRELGFFETPPEIVDNYLIPAADLRRKHKALEPSAGRGAIALRIAPMVSLVDCFEIDAANAAHLCGVVAFPSTVTRGNFLCSPPAPAYDRIVMNPPFGGQADIKHVMHALGFLARRGRLVSVMSAGALFRTNKLATDFRALVDRCGGSITPLPAGSFHASGTDVSAVMAVIPWGTP